MNLNKVLFATAMAAFGTTSPVMADRAVLIGGQSPTVDGAADAQRFADALIQSGGFSAADVLVLTGRNVTRAVVLNALTHDLQANTTAGDAVVIYFSGVGGQVEGAQASSEADGMDEAFVLNAQEHLLDDELEAAIDALEGRRVSVYLDTAFKGMSPTKAAGYRGVGRIAPQTQPETVAVETEEKVEVAAEPGPLETTNPTAEIWSAATPDSGAWSDATGIGSFTSMLVDAMTKGNADLNDSGVTSSTELMSHSVETLAQVCASIEYCEVGRQGFNPSRVVVEDTRLVLSDARLDGILSDALPTDVSSFAPPPAIPEMSHEQRVAFVSDRFGSINRANVQLEVFPGPTMSLGDKVWFELSAEKDGSFILIDIDPLGRVVQVYPSSLSPTDSTSVKAGTEVLIPSILSANGMPLQISVTEPVGQGLLMAIFVEGDLKQIDKVLPEDLAGRPANDGFNFLYELADSLLGLYATAGTATQIWSTQYIEYEIRR
ncbi:hypothetical protein ACMU_08925 [Actibacterium mucosum KCTC 23349]|uniref:Uncharacterized protein n=2 Tax=Actibacterium TaxID=1433986 RepID=A0A037ZM40_9RHOB|nr:hypothetical protein ACMU_08925 [Actibacterium mucosum KCTC 23349]